MKYLIMVHYLRKFIQYIILFLTLNQSYTLQLLLSTSTPTTHGKLYRCNNWDDDVLSKYISCLRCVLAALTRISMTLTPFLFSIFFSSYFYLLQITYVYCLYRNIYLYPSKRQPIDIDIDSSSSSLATDTYLGCILSFTIYSL